MGNDICFLITIFDGTSLLKCALKTNKEELGSFICEYPMEPESKTTIHEMLPEDVRTKGFIVDITTELHEVVIL